jgi:hypothetical protein
MQSCANRLSCRFVKLPTAWFVARAFKRNTLIFNNFLNADAHCKHVQMPTYENPITRISHARLLIKTKVDKLFAFIVAYS